MDAGEIRVGKLITVVGNTGVGKTTFVQHLCLKTGFVKCLEQHYERPFHNLFSLDHESYAFANQIDFLLFRAEQELEIRNGEKTGVQDGGLDEDYFLFTRLFFQKGFLTDREFGICERTYRTLREFLPPPDLVVWLQAPLTVLTERIRLRDRRLGIIEIDDLKVMEELLENWLSEIDSTPLITIDTVKEGRDYSMSIPLVLERFNRLITREE
jgi:deoxyadenosine/deoxycytidine kinase